MPGYIQTILNAFTSLDIEKLRLHLKDEYSYEDTTKAIFLDALEKVFKRFKNAGNTALMMYEGKCPGNNCPNCGKKGFRFVGKHLMNYIDLLFEIDGDDIKNITVCEEFTTDVDIEDLGIRSEIEIRLDERHSFDKTPEYLAKVRAAETAWNEIITTPPGLVDFDLLCYWVDKHTVAFDLIDEPDSFEAQKMKWTPFLLLYNDLKEFRDYISKNVDKIKVANSKIETIKTENELMEWLLKYEDSGEQSPFDMKYGAFKNEGDYFRWNYQNPIHFKDEVFFDAIRFLRYYKEQHTKMLEKYSVYTSEEASIQYNFCGSKEETKKLTSLSFHLQNRKELENKGIFIPLWINEMDSDN